MSNDRRKKSEDLFDLAVDYMERRIRQEEIPATELKTMLEFLDRQGINCVGQRNPKVSKMLDLMPAKVAAEQDSKSKLN